MTKDKNQIVFHKKME